MQDERGHIGDPDLLMARLGGHLAACASCRRRKAELDEVLRAAADAQRRELDPRLPPMAESRAALRARMRQERGQRNWLAWAAAAAVLAVGVGAVIERGAARNTAFAPNAMLTPGGVRPLTREAVCSAGEAPAISGAVAQEVFRRYGIRNPRPRTYEVDYLIPPALGGSDDPRNLWPEPYAAGVWNARVKDALEDRLRTMVCDGRLDLATAQRDLARDWIGAYKKYFRTGAPLVDHVAFVKDRPWE